MELETKRLKLQEVTESDVEQIYKLHSSPEVDEYNTLGIPENIEVTESLVRPMIKAQKAENRKSYDWKIIRKDSGEFIGLAGISLSANRFKLGEIYYELFPSHWGQGFATEVTKALIKAGFDDFHLHKVEAGVATGNVRSIRVLEKSGMIREGLRRKILPIRGEWKDNYHYAIVEDDPRDY
jgi:RimJ/RimL family protein N-acetyltransferase